MVGKVSLTIPSQIGTDWVKLLKTAPLGRPIIFADGHVESIDALVLKSMMKMETTRLSFLLFKN